MLDASEIPPTFGVSYELIQGVIAGGYDALYKATEASEDNKQAGGGDIKQCGLTNKDASSASPLRAERHIRSEHSNTLASSDALQHV